MKARLLIATTVLWGCVAHAQTAVSVLQNMRRDLAPLFASFGDSATVAVTNDALIAQYEIEPGRTWVNADGKGGGGYTAYPRTNGVRLVACVVKEESWRKRNRTWPTTEATSHGERYRHWFQVGGQRSSEWIDVSLEYGNWADTNTVTKIRAAVEAYATTTHNQPSESIRHPADGLPEPSM